MQWDIITGSKGGVGKTLLTLLLLEYYLERKPDEGVLVLDLNAMNADTSAMLLYNKRNFGNKPILIELENQERIILQQSFSLGKDTDVCYFGVGYPTDPFTLFGRQQFVDLLSRIKKNTKEIEVKLGIPPLQHIILDTNYHFCNLFPEQDQEYTKYVDNGLTEDTINIWFLWVYRQLFKLLLQGNESENEIIKMTAGAIERVFNNKGIGSIIHTYTPVGLLAIPNEQENFWLKLMFADNTARRDQDHTIEKMLELERLKVGQYLEFKKWTQQLHQAHIEIRSKNKLEDSHLLFTNVLDNAIRRIVNDDNDSLLPINIFPLSIYQSALEGYTDKEREDAVAALRNLTIYKNFSRLLERKYESLRL